VLTTGIYDLATGKRLTMHSLDGATGDQFVLGTLTITP
jgi:hypothetical protein